MLYKECDLTFKLEKRIKKMKN